MLVMCGLLLFSCSLYVVSILRWYKLEPHQRLMMAFARGKILLLKLSDKKSSEINLKNLLPWLFILF